MPDRRPLLVQLRNGGMRQRVCVLRDGAYRRGQEDLPGPRGPDRTAARLLQVYRGGLRHWRLRHHRRRDALHRGLQAR